MALGYFDGVHCGHQQVIHHTLAIAERSGLPAAIMTFHPHPRVVLGQAQSQQSLTPLEDKLALFKSMGIQYVYLVHFTPRFAEMSADAFVNTVLRPLHVQAVVVGFDFKYGHEGQGTPERLRATGKTYFE